MAMSNETRLAIKAKLRLGSSPQEVSEQFNIGIQTIYHISKVVKQEMGEDVIHDLHSLSPETITHVVEEAKKDLPMPTPGSPAPMVEAFDAVVAGASGLKKLDMSFQTTMTGVLSRFDELLRDKDMPLKDIIQISSATANAYEKIFTSGTNIHIGDNNNSSQQLTIFKNKQGV